MFRKLFILYLVFFCSLGAFAQFSIKGTVTNKSTKKPIENVLISLNDNTYWTSSNKSGNFEVSNIPAGNYKISFKILGFVTIEIEQTVNANNNNLAISLEEYSLKLPDVEINAKKSKSVGTSYLIDKTALDHLQILSINDATALLPGGKTSATNNLASTTAQRFSIIGKSGEFGNATFGVGVEVNGVRISNNSSRELAGIDTKNISTNNIESIEIITGVPGVEYGDISNGIVSITTKKGKSNYTLDLNTSPNNKSIALSKGFNLGSNGGVLNFNLEHLKSVANIASPYTTYDRNGIDLIYSNTLNKEKKQPIQLNIGISGNIGGFNSKSDPDKFVNTYSKVKDNVLRVNYGAKWLLNKSWITNLDFTGNVNYNDKLSETSTNKSATSSVAAMHSTTEGYFIGETYAQNPNANLILIPRGFWYETNFTDSKQLNFANKLKANWFKKIGNTHNNVLIGFEYSRTGNLGDGQYYGDYQFAPTWRPYAYKDESFVNNYVSFIENRFSLPIAKNFLEITAGLRNDLTSVKGSEYGNVNSLSPRANLKYTFIKQSETFVKDFDVKLGYGKSVKLPSFNILYAVPSYTDILTFSPGTTSNGDTFYAYYTKPIAREFNKDLKWQYTIQKEIAFNLNLDGNQIFISASSNKTFDPYTSQSVYTPYSYKLTAQQDIEKSAIPINNRQYLVDQSTGIVTITDKTGSLPSEIASYKSLSTFNSRSRYFNGSPITRSGLSFIVNFKQIKPLKTSFQVDGNYYYYKGIEESVITYRPNSTVLMSDGSLYKYIGYFSGGGNSANGSISKSLNLNVTATTHIPSVGLIVSARLEASIYNFSKNLSEINGKQRGFVIDNAESFTPSTSSTDIYAGNKLVGLYPDYYVSLEDMNKRIPFAEMYAWAKANNPAMYNDLSKMVVKTNYNYYFNDNKISSYVSANIGLTKEIGKIASITFNAKNFFNNMGVVTASGSHTESSLYGSSYIPKFYYSVSLRLKI